MVSVIKYIQNFLHFSESVVSRKLTNKKGRVRTKTVKKSARFLVEKYYSLLTTDFQINKIFCDEVALIPSKGLRNKIAGFVTHLMKRLSRGVIKGLNVKIEEKELDTDKELAETLYNSNFENKVNVDRDTEDMLENLFTFHKEILQN